MTVGFWTTVVICGGGGITVGVWVTVVVAYPVWTYPLVMVVALFLGSLFTSTPGGYTKGLGPTLFIGAKRV